MHDEELRGGKGWSPGKVKAICARRLDANLTYSSHGGLEGVLLQLPM